jgi:membrane protein required for colicin V production
VNETLSFIAIALGVMIVAGMVGRLIRWSVKSVGLGWMDRLAGAAFGVVKGCALVTVAVMVMAAFWPNATWFRQSRFAPEFLSMAHAAAAVAPAELGDRIRSGVDVLRKAQPEWMRPTA